MPTVTETELSRSSVTLGSGVSSLLWEEHTARLEGRRLKWPSSEVAVISAHGDIDASNAGALAEYTLGHVIGCHRLILDLRGLDFFGAQGFSSLHKVAAGCARAGISWILIPSAAVDRVLQICDPQDTLPVASTPTAALAELGHPPDGRHRVGAGLLGCRTAVAAVSGGVEHGDDR